MGRGVTRAVSARPGSGTLGSERRGNPARPDRGTRAIRAIVHPSEDGGTWRGPTAAAWTTRLLRGAPAPRESTGNALEAPAART